MRLAPDHRRRAWYQAPEPPSPVTGKTGDELKCAVPNLTTRHPIAHLERPPRMFYCGNE